MTTQMTASSAEQTGPFGTERLTTGDVHVDEILGRVADACSRLESLSIELDRGHRDMDALLAAGARDEAALAELRARMEATMADIIRLEGVLIPGLLRSLQEVGIEKAFGAGMAQSLQSRLNSVAQQSDLTIENEPVHRIEERSPWDID